MSATEPNDHNALMYQELGALVEQIKGLFTLPVNVGLIITCPEQPDTQILFGNLDVPEVRAALDKMEQSADVMQPDGSRLKRVDAPSYIKDGAPAPVQRGRVEVVPFAWLMCADDADFEGCGSVPISKEEYTQQLSVPDKPWRCPLCQRDADYDDAKSERAQGV